MRAGYIYRGGINGRRNRYRRRRRRVNKAGLKMWGRVLAAGKYGATVSVATVAPWG